MIRRERVVLAALAGALAFAAWPGLSLAQQPEEEPQIEITPDEPGETTPTAPPEEPEIEIGEDPTTPPVVAAKGKGKEAGEARASWRDVVVVKRKPFLKNGRVELVPTLGVTLNDNMIRHYQFSAQINYWLTDALAVGVEGEYYRRDLLTPYEQIGVQYRRVPTLNQYNFGAALNFHYVPIYAKFAVMNKHIIHWEAYFTAGVGFQQSEVLPRDPALQGWTNFLITPNVGFTMRVFITKFITLNIGVRDYVFNDKFESPDRSRDQTLEEAMENSASQFINHIVIQAGLSFWVPPTFSYTTFR